MAYDIKHIANGMLSTRESEELATDRKRWSTLNGICRKESKKASESYRRLKYSTGKMGLFYIRKYQKQDKTLTKKSAVNV